MAAPAQIPQSTEPLEDRIRLRAYELYLDRGAQDGLALDDWLQAEAEIIAQMTPKEGY